MLSSGHTLMSNTGVNRSAKFVWTLSYCILLLLHLYQNSSMTSCLLMMYW